MSIRRALPVDGPDNTRPPAVVGRSCLITDSGLLTAITEVRETDARTALARGVKEYLAQLPPFTHPNGRTVQIFEMFDVWAEQEKKRKYPSGIAYSTGPGTYDSTGFTPQINPNCKISDTQFLIKYSELTINLTVDIVTTDPEERIAIVMMLEDALNPVEWMYGFRLELPHYHNLRGTYELMDNNFPDDEAKVFQRNRHVVFTLKAAVPVVRLKTLPILTEVRSTVTVVDGNDC
jgi:hypothetical protein